MLPFYSSFSTAGCPDEPAVQAIATAALGPTQDPRTGIISDREIFFSSNGHGVGCGAREAAPPRVGCQLLVCRLEGGADPKPSARSVTNLPTATVRRPNNRLSTIGTDSTEPQRWPRRLRRRGCWCAGWKSKSSSIDPHSRIFVQTLRPSAVDPELPFQTNRAVRPDPLGQNDLVHGTCACKGSGEGISCFL